MYTLRGKELDVVLIEINGRHPEVEEAVIGVITRSTGELGYDDLILFVVENEPLLLPMVLRTHLQWIAEEALGAPDVVH